MPTIDPRNIEVMDPIKAAALRRMSLRESLQESFRLTELKRQELADEIALSHPAWSPREVELERNRQWLLMGLEDEFFGASSEVLYDLLCVNQHREGADLDRVVRILSELPDSFRISFTNVVEQLGLQNEWLLACSGTSLGDH